jgi:hypothetical protein
MPNPKRPQDPQDAFDFVIKQIESVETDPDRHTSILIDDAIRDAVKGAMATGQKAKVTITLAVTPSSDFRVARDVAFSAKIKADIPRAPIPAVRVFADRDTGELMKADPAQHDIEEMIKNKTN